MKAHLRLCEKISSAAKDELKAEDTAPTPAKRPASRTPEGKALPKIARMLNACPTPTVAEKDAIVAAWARFFFGSGTPFSHVEDKLFLEALNATRPGLSPELFFPKRHSLGTKWLDRIHKEEAEPQMKDLLAAAHIAIMCDVWKNDRSEKVFAVTAIGDGSPVLLQSGVLSEKRHRATEFLGHLKKIHEQVLGKIVAILVDGDSTAVASANLFKAFQTEAGRQTPFVCICACHTVARALNDCIGVRTERKREAKNEFHFVAALLSALSSQLRNVEFLSKTYAEKQQQCGRRKSKKMVKPAVTRWHTFSTVWKEVEENRNALLLMNQEEAVCSSCPEIGKVLDATFWGVFMGLKPFVAGVGEVMNFLEQDGCTAGMIIPALSYLIDCLNACNLTSAANKAKLAAVTEKVKKRLQKYTTHEQGWLCAATALTPLFFAPDREKQPTFIKEFTLKLDVRKAAQAFIKKVKNAEAAAELLELITRTGGFDDDSLWDLAQGRKACQWWKTVAQLHPTSQVAPLAAILTRIPASTSTAERVFSTMGWMSEHRRHRLTAAKTHKLTLVHRSLKAKKTVVEEGWWNLEELENDEKNMMVIDEQDPPAAGESGGVNADAGEADEESGSETSWD